jgi:uncharacterized Zn finger protein/DNA-binding transcriptional regulator YiaG
VAERKAKGQKAVEAMRKKGVDVQPVVIEGRTIAKSFWGKTWCDYLESFGDFESRLPRGRTYVRNGSVCHLAIDKGSISAKVSGSSMYNVSINIKTLDNARWERLKTSCAGKIGSLIELLQGKFSNDVMTLVMDKKSGLLPSRQEISYTCSCPDWASMCKHVAAVIYGVGARLDHQPELLFLLRGTDHSELIQTNVVSAVLTGTGSERRSRRQASEEVQALFNVEIEPAKVTPVVAPKVKPAKVSPPKAPKPTKVSPPKVPKPAKVSLPKAPKPAKVSLPKAPKPAKVSLPKAPKPFNATARSIKTLRQKLGLNGQEFAKACGVSPATVSRWEATTGQLKLNEQSLLSLQALRDGETT